MRLLYRMMLLVLLPSSGGLKATTIVAVLLSTRESKATIAVAPCTASFCQGFEGDMLKLTHFVGAMATALDALKDGSGGR